MNPITRKNILILAHNYAPQFVDICNQYAKLFDPKKYHVTIAYLSGKPDEHAKQSTQAEEVIFISHAKKDIRGFKLSAIRNLISLCRERKFEIVICHRYKPIYVMLWVAQFCKIPRLFFVMHAMKTLTSLSRRILIACLARPNMYFAGVSNAVRDDLRSKIFRVPQERVITLYNCIDTVDAEPKILSREEARNYFSLPEKTLVFGTVGRLAPEKDQSTLIKAFAKIKPHYPQAKLLIIGAGPVESTLKKLTQELDLTNEVIFAGKIPGAYRYMKVLDVFILCSVKEAFGRVLLEAMLAKVPVIGTRTDGIPEVMEDVGIVAEPKNARSLADAMIRMAEFSSETRKEWGQKSYEHVKQCFSLERFNELFWSLEAD